MTKDSNENDVVRVNGTLFKTSVLTNLFSLSPSLYYIHISYFIYIRPVLF